MEFNCGQCNRSYKSQGALKKHTQLEHSATNVVYACKKCSSKCGQPHTLREHYSAKHSMDVSTEFIKTECCQKKNSHTKKSELKYPKRVHEIILCTCGIKNKGNWVFKRHVQNKHNSNNFDKFKGMCAFTKEIEYSSKIYYYIFLAKVRHSPFVIVIDIV